MINSKSSPITLSQSAIGWLIPSLITGNAATYSQTLTVITVTSTGHNIPATVYNGMKVYLDFGAAATGATLVDGWYTNFQYVDANTFTCESTLSQTGTGTVNTNVAEITLPDVSGNIVGGLIGLNGKLFNSFLFTNNNSAGTKTARFYLGNTIFSNYANTTVTSGVVELRSIQNCNSLARQIAGFISMTGVLTSGALTQTSLNTAITIAYSFRGQCSTASDFIAFHSAAVMVQPS